MQKEIQSLEAAVLLLAKMIEIGQVDGVFERIEEILNYKKD